jgi:hypothetical protein
MSKEREKTFSELLELPEGWDSYGSDIINPAAVDKLREILESEWIVPTSDGGVYVSWGDENIGVTVTGNLEVKWHGPYEDEKS